MDDKQNPPTKKTVIFYLETDADAQLDALTNNRSWLVNKLIKDEFLRVQSANRRGKEIRRQPAQVDQ